MRRSAPTTHLILLDFFERYHPKNVMIPSKQDEIPAIRRKRQLSAEQPSSSRLGRIRLFEVYVDRGQRGLAEPEDEELPHESQTKKLYIKPAFRFDRVFETQALSCGKFTPSWGSVITIARIPSQPADLMASPTIMGSTVMPVWLKS